MGEMGNGGNGMLECWKTKVITIKFHNTGSAKICETLSMR
jgi:hypothetical protein